MAETLSQRLERIVARSGSPPLARSLMSRGLGAYRGYAELIGQFLELGRRGARLRVLGDSVGSEPIIALEIGNLGTERTSVVLSGVHPLEWIGIETHLSLLRHLLERQPSDRCILSVPLLNPDGYREVERSLRSGRHRFLRHNRRKVDLNRNFPSFWGRWNLSRILLPFIFRPGSAPASEPEVGALIDALGARTIDRALSLHSFGGVVLHPYGAKWRAPSDAAEHRRWANHIARRADPKKPYRVLQPSRWLPGFTAPGMDLDYFHDAHGALSLLIECSRGGLSLSAPKLIEPFAWFNPEQLEPIAERIAGAVDGFVRGHPHPEG
jgi:hypothetical protein